MGTRSELYKDIFDKESKLIARIKELEEQLSRSQQIISHTKTALQDMVNTYQDMIDVRTLAKGTLTSNFKSGEVNGLRKAKAITNAAIHNLEQATKE